MVAITHPVLRPARLRPTPPTAATFRRRRLVAAVLVTLLLVSFVVTASRLLASPPAELDGARPVAELSVLVQPGDTVWSIAESLADGGDVRPVVDAITRANGGAALRAGDRLTVVVP